MAHHKKRRAWSQRGGCAACKWWKINGIKGGLRAKARRRALLHEETSMR